MKSQYDVYMCRESKEMLHYRKIARRKLILAGSVEPETDEEKALIKVAKAVYSDKTDIYKFGMRPLIVTPSMQSIHDSIQTSFQHDGGDDHYGLLKSALAVVFVLSVWTCFVLLASGWFFR
jgi:hypothetical protein